MEIKCNMKIDKLAKEMFGKSNFNKCTEEEQECVIKVILDEVTVKYMRRIYGDSDII